MITTISSINIRYKNNDVDLAEIHFSSREEDYSVTTNGYFHFTKEEFEGKSVRELVEMIKEKHVERIINPFAPDEEENEEGYEHTGD